MTVPFLLLAALAGAVAVVAWVRTPDHDRPRVYPREPERWAGITGKPASLRNAFGTLLFWAVAALGFGAAGALVSAFAPGNPALALTVGAIVAVALPLWTAREMLRVGP